MAKFLEMFIDGASRGNPGPAGIGIFIADETGKALLKKAEFLGTTTSNSAEYQALIRGLKFLAKQNHNNEQIVIKSDSDLVINQMKGEYRIKSKTIMPLAIEARQLLKNFPNAELKLIERKYNKVADKLANKSMNLEGDIDCTNEPADKGAS